MYNESLSQMRRLLLFFMGFFFLVSCSKDVLENPGDSNPNTDNGNTDNNGSNDVAPFSGALPFFRVTSDISIQNEPKVAGDLKVFINQENTFSTPIGVEYRGSTSFRLTDKKSYGIEIWDENNIDADASLLGFPEEEDWILMGHVFRSNENGNTIFDPSLMHHYISYNLYASLGHYASRSKFIELEVNGEYMGAYILMEKLKRDLNRINIAEMLPTDNAAPNITGGYILKIDKTAGGDVVQNQPPSYYENNWGDDALYSEPISFRSNYSTDRNRLNDAPYQEKQGYETYFLYEYPKATNITNEQKQYIQTYIDAFESALLSDDFSSQTRTYTDYIDLDSFVDFFIMNELTTNVDGYRLSTYLHKDRGQKLKMGPVWDFNIGFHQQNRIPDNDWVANYNTHAPNDLWLVPFWWTRLLEDPVFQQRLKERWETFRSSQLANATVLNLVQNTADYLTTNGAIDRNYSRWSGIDVNYNQVITDLKANLEARLGWMDQKISEF